jgi:hypothetical protein
MTKSCKICHQQFTLSDEDLKLYQKFNEEPRDICFEDAQKRRLCFRNERSLYRRKCDATGEEIISIYSPDKPYIVYKSDYWYSDKWDALDYGQDIDFSKPFFDQFKELQLKVPRLALSNMKGVNSEFCNMTCNNKNCYLIFGGDFNEDSMFGVLCMHNRNVAECDYSNYCELCYEIQDCTKCYNIDFAADCKNCHDCSYISDCIGCNNCILCTNQINKSYCIENNQLTKEEFEKKKKELLKNSEETYKKFLDLREKRVVKFAYQSSCENCAGNYLKHCKNCQNCFDCTESEDMKDIIYAINCKDCFNADLLGHGSQLIYNSISTFTAFNIKHCYLAVDSSNLEYCEGGMNCSDLFGCIGLRHKKYCILNKQYSKEEFETLKSKLITHMKETKEYGQFFPPSLSCFAYNESTAHAYFPLTKEQALEQGYKWKD